jgi:hypothetical protein
VRVDAGASLGNVVGDGLWMGVKVNVGVLLGSGVADGVPVAVKVNVGVSLGEGVADGVPVAVKVNVGVSLGIGVADGVPVSVKVNVGVSPGIGVADGVSVGMRVGAGVSLDVGLGDGTSVDAVPAAGVLVAVTVNAVGLVDAGVADTGVPLSGAGDGGVPAHAGLADVDAPGGLEGDGVMPPGPEVEAYGVPVRTRVSEGRLAWVEDKEGTTPGGRAGVGVGLPSNVAVVVRATKGGIDLNCRPTMPNTHRSAAATKSRSAIHRPMGTAVSPSEPLCLCFDLIWTLPLFPSEISRKVHQSYLLKM